MLISSKQSSPFSAPRACRRRIERHAEAVANAVREYLLQVRAASPPIGAPAAKNGLSVGVVPSSFRRRITPVRCALSGSGPPNWSSAIPGPWAVDEVLHLPAPAVVADEDVQLAVRAEADHAAVVVAARRLAGVLLEGAQPDQVRRSPASNRSSGSGPRGCRAAAHQRARGVGASRALRPVQVDGRGPGTAGATRCRAARAPTRSSRPDRAPFLRGPVGDALHLARSPSRGRGSRLRRGRPSQSGATSCGEASRTARLVSTSVGSGACAWPCEAASTASDGGAEHGGRQRVSHVRRHDIAPPVSTGVVGDRGAIKVVRIGRRRLRFRPWTRGRSHGSRPVRRSSARAGSACGRTRGPAPRPWACSR